MKRNLQRIVICFSFFIFWNGGKEAKAQWVTIPDANFVAFLNLNYPTCMNGNQMDTTCSSIINQTVLMPTSLNISNLDGVQYFDNLNDLECMDNSLSTFPVLPLSLKTLNCVGNNFSNFPSIPATLISFYCSENQLTSLPNLPDSLEQFGCSNNFLTTIPPLPKTLKLLSCGNNLLTNLPPLPDSLTYLDCRQNTFLNLPLSLPDSLRIFDCSFSLHTSLPPLPDSLKELYCRNNLLATLPLLPAALAQIECQNNSILNLPTLPATLYKVDCYINQLTSLPTLPNSLKYLDCNSNFLTSLPALPKSLLGLNCSANLLTYIPDLPDTMAGCDVSHMLSLTCLPKLKNISFLNFTNTGITCIPNYGNVANSYPALSTLPLCDLFNSNGCTAYWNISGKVFSEVNNNCISDTNELPFSNLKLMLDSSGVLIQQTFTGVEGLYSFDTDTGTYTYTVDTTNLSVMVSCPTSGFRTSVLILTDSMDFDMDFGMQCKPGFDVGVNAIVRESGRFSPANFATVNIKAGDMTNKYGLHCSSGISGTVTVIINGAATFIAIANGSLIPTVNGDTLTYSIADFGTVNFTSDFKIIVQTDTTAAIGSTVCFDVSVIPTSGDIYPANNWLQKCFNVVSSYDPNEKEVYPIDRIDDKNGKLTYTIHFQNTGIAPAQHIYILDTLDAAIDESSFELLAYSHQPQMQIKGNVVRFNFPNINLPDSVSNEPASHGYVQYRVKLKDSLALGTVISNTSYIYFDFNTPVQTNTVFDTLTDCNSLAAIDVINQTFCAGDTLKLNAALAYPATTDWYVDSIFISNNQNILIPNLSTGNHEIKMVATNAYCNTEVVSNVEIHSLPLVDLGNDTANCFQYLIDAGVGFSSYLWSNGATAQAIIANTTANYSVVVTDGNGCSNKDTISITINALPSKPIITQNISLLTSSSSTGNQWMMNGNLIAGATNATYTVAATGWFNVQVTDSNGCSNVSDSIYMDLTGVNAIANPHGEIHLIPNPTTSSFAVWGVKFEVNDVVIITDALGKIIQQIKIAQPTSNLKLETLNYKSGVYFVNIRTSKFSTVLKLVKE